MEDEVMIIEKRVDKRNKKNGGDGRNTAPARIGWVFRMSATFGYEDDDLEGWALQGILTPYCKCFAFQLESAPTTGYLHYQGYLELLNKNRHTWIQNLLEQNGMHFEYLKARKGTPQQAWSYATKQETQVKGPWIYGELDIVEKKGKDTTYADALQAPSYEEAMAIIKSNKPRDFCLYGTAISHNLMNHIKVKPKAPKYDLTKFNVNPLIFHPTKTLLIWGNSNTGKTQFALAHFKNPLVITHMDTLKRFNIVENDAIIFDDMSFQHLHPEAVIHILDREVDRDIHIRYGTARIPAGVIKVITHNKKSIFYKEDIDEVQKEAIDRRIDYYHVVGKLFI